MRNALLATLAGLGLAGAWMRVDTPMTLQPESKLWVEGTSTTKSWSCKAAIADADIIATDANAATAILAGEKAVRSVAITVAAPKLDCGNGTMTKHALKALEADKHKTIVFTLSGYELSRAAAGARSTLKGTLTLGGVTRPVAITAMATDAGAGKVRVAGTYALKMSDYGLKPPSLMMGAMKVGDQVTVNFDLQLKAAPPTTSAQ